MCAVNGGRYGVLVRGLECECVYPLPVCFASTTALRSGDVDRPCLFGPIPARGRGPEEDYAGCAHNVVGTLRVP